MVPGQEANNDNLGKCLGKCFRFSLHRLYVEAILMNTLSIQLQYKMKKKNPIFRRNRSDHMLNERTNEGMTESQLISLQITWLMGFSFPISAV